MFPGFLGFWACLIRACPDSRLGGLGSVNRGGVLCCRIYARKKKTAGGAFLPCRPLIGLIFIASGRESENNHNTDCDTI